MVSQETIEIILRAIDNASGPTKNVDDAMKKVGDSAQQANQKAANASKLTQQQMNNLSHEIKEVIASTDQVGAKGESQFNRYDNALQDSIVTFNRLDEETQEMLRYLSQMSDKGRETFLGMSTKAQEAVAKFNQLENETTGWNNVLDITKTKMELVGTSTTTLPGKIQMVGTAIQTHLGNKWDSLKTKVSGFGNYIKSTLGSAISHVKGMVNSLGSAFSGLGGMISTAIGGLGMASISQMTVGLAMNRERMTALTSATMGSAEAGKQFVDVMDDLTNKSLVSLDDLGQAMSTIKMSTGMSNEQLKDFTATVNDVGQRAILMGKNGDEAMALMQAAGRGLNGEFDMLKTNFGITADKLKELGWSGAADDVKGYQDALKKALEAGGSMNGMMDTSVGHIETLKKNFRVAGRHVGEMFTPYIDQAVQKLNSLNETCPGLFENLVMIAGAISGFATIAPTLAPMLSAFESLYGGGKKVLNLFRESAVIEAFWTALTSGEGIIAAITAGYGEMAIAEYIALGPLLAIIAAIIAIGVAVYELGKYFGWWNDVGSMLQAVWAGLNRLWSAFINHPDVQAAIQAISQAFQILGGAIMWVVGKVLEFFNISQGGEFDIVHAIIMAIGAAWEVMSGKIKLVIQVVTILVNAFMEFYNNTLVPFGSYISEVLGPVFEYLKELWATLIEAVQPLLEVFDQFQNGQADLLDVIVTVASTLWNVWVTLSVSLSNLILTLVANLLTWATQAGLNFLNGISIYLSQVAGRVFNYLNNTKTRIISQLNSWVSNARAKASQFLNAILNYIRQLPGKVYSQLLAVLARIVSAGTQWVSNAKQKAQEVVDGAVNTLSSLPGKISSALSGVVDAIVQPFRDAYNYAKEQWDKIADLASNIPVVGSAGSDAAGGETSTDVITGDMFDIYSGEVVVDKNQKIDVEIVNKIILDLINVPAHIDTDTLIKMLENPEVLKALIRNPDFQSLDAKVKAEIEKRVKRAKGA